MIRNGKSTFIVLATGQLGDHIARLAAEHAALDTDRRQISSPGDLDFPSHLLIMHWTAGTAAAAIVLRPDGSLSALLDSGRALNEAWIEDAFLRAGAGV